MIEATPYLWFYNCVFGADKLSRNLRVCLRFCLNCSRITSGVNPAWVNHDIICKNQTIANICLDLYSYFISLTLLRSLYFLGVIPQYFLKAVESAL